MTWHVAIRARVGALDLDVDIQGNGTTTALIGPNGSGKTTLLRMIAGAHRPDGGTIGVDNRPLFDSWRHIEVPPEERQVGYVPQGYGLFPHLRVLDNVAFGLASRTRGRDQRHQAALALLDELGCAHLAGRMPRALSGGEQQRVALARALMVEPQILLLDEPLAALDASSRRGVRSFLQAHLVERARPALVVTHDLRDVLCLTGQVLVLDNGKIVQRGTAAELREQPGSEFVAEFFDVEPCASVVLT